MKIKNKKGVSAVVGVVLMVALVLGLVAIIWTLITGVVEKELSGTKSCFGNFDQVTINKRYTCLDTENNQLNFSVSVGDLNVSEIIVTISGAGEIQTIRINEEDSYDFAKNLKDELYDFPLNLPEANSGKTYSINLTNLGFGKIDYIEIAPVIGGTTCDISDSISTIENCKSFFN